MCRGFGTSFSASLSDVLCVLFLWVDRSGKGAVVIPEASSILYVLSFCFSWKLAWCWHLVKWLKRRGAIFKRDFGVRDEEFRSLQVACSVIHILVHYGEHNLYASLFFLFFCFLLVSCYILGASRPCESFKSSFVQSKACTAACSASRVRSGVKNKGFSEKIKMHQRSSSFFPIWPVFYS